MTKVTHFFLGANSGLGFRNLFDQFCTPEHHHDLLVLKGGPGVGKSTMMKRVGHVMEERGEQVEYLYCSGDPKSLDGVHIPRIRVAIVDGTAPQGAVSKGHFGMEKSYIYIWQILKSSHYFTSFIPHVQVGIFRKYAKGIMSQPPFIQQRALLTVLAGRLFYCTTRSARCQFML